MKRSLLTASATALLALTAFSTAAPGIPVAKPSKRTPGPTEITAREATFDNRTHEASFTGEVIVKDPEFGLSCEKLSIYLKKPAEPAPLGAAPNPKPQNGADAGSGIDKAIAEVDVIITMDKPDANGKPQRYIGRAKKAIFDNASGVLTLSGWPQIAESMGGSVSKQILSREEGCVIVIDRAGKIDVKGYHTSTLKEVGAAEAPQR